jgi:hypothetical protein
MREQADIGHQPTPYRFKLVMPIHDLPLQLIVSGAPAVLWTFPEMQLASILKLQTFLTDAKEKVMDWKIKGSGRAEIWTFR